MDIDFSILLMKASAYSILLPILILLIRVKGLGRHKKLIGALVLVRALTELLSNYIGKILERPNLPLLHIYTFIEFGLLAYIIGSTLHPIIRSKQLHWMVGAFTIVAILNGWIGEGFFHFNAYIRALEGLILISLALLYFYKLLKDLKIQRIEREPVFWVSLGVLLYFSGSLFLFLISNVLNQEATKTLSMTIWGIHSFLNIMLNIILAIALWVKQPR